MTEKKRSRRAWVIPAAIVFLVVLLVLTLLSNTIMNYSLPEVAVQYVSSGSISATIRGTGKVTPVEAYELTFDQTRKVQSVLVSVGDDVAVGDVLMVMATGDSDELETAQTDLENMELAYQQAVIEYTGADYATEYRNIQAKRDQISAAQSQLNSLGSVTDEQIASKQAEVNQASALMQEKLSAKLLAQAAFDNFTGDVTSNEYQQIVNARVAADAAYDAAESAHSQKETELSNLIAQQSSLVTQRETLQAEIKQYQQELSDYQFALSEAQKAAAKTNSKNTLDLENQLKKIEKQKAYIEELQGGGAESQITSDVAGKVTAINISAGNTTTPDTAMIVIDVVDRGYYVEMAVTSDQAKKVSVGDPVNITSYYYWGMQMSGTLATIKTDPDNPGTSKILRISVTGDVEPGSSVNIAVSEKSADYACRIPNSAIYEDADGKFVYIISSKSSPLGNRYYATRTAVTILATDDTNSAVSGVTASDYVITTSNLPLENGMQVKQVDGW